MQVKPNYPRRRLGPWNQMESETSLQNETAVLSLCGRHDVVYFCSEQACLGLPLVNTNSQCTISQRKRTTGSKHGESTLNYQPRSRI